MNGNATETVIAASNVPVIVAGNWADVGQAPAGSFSFVQDPLRITYLDDEDRFCRIDAIGNAKVTLGSGDQADVGIAINGTNNPGVMFQADQNFVQWSAIGFVTLNKDDFIELTVENRIGNKNILLEAVRIIVELSDLNVEEQQQIACYAGVPGIFLNKV